MKRMLTKAKKKIKDFFTLVNYPYGIDKEYDKESNKDFLNFLDYLYYAIVGCFSIFAALSIYFFIMYGM